MPIFLSALSCNKAEKSVIGLISFLFFFDEAFYNTNFFGTSVCVLIFFSIFLRLKLSVFFSQVLKLFRKLDIMHQ